MNKDDCEELVATVLGDINKAFSESLKKHTTADNGFEVADISAFAFLGNHMMNSAIAFKEGGAKDVISEYLIDCEEVFIAYKRQVVDRFSQ